MRQNGPDHDIRTGGPGSEPIAGSQPSRRPGLSYKILHDIAPGNKYYEAPQHCFNQFLGHKFL